MTDSLTIRSVDGQSQLTIRPPNDADEYPYFVAEIDVRVLAGRIHAKRLDLYLDNVGKFVSQLDCFILDRKASARLEAGRGSYFEISGKETQVTLSTALHTDSAGAPLSHHYKFSCAFDFEQENLISVLEWFKQFVRRP